MASRVPIGCLSVSMNLTPRSLHLSCTAEGTVLSLSKPAFNLRMHMSVSYGTIVNVTLLTISIGLHQPLRTGHSKAYSLMYMRGGRACNVETTIKVRALRYIVQLVSIAYRILRAYRDGAGFCCRGCWMSSDRSFSQNLRRLLRRGWATLSSSNEHG
jgi:hypothetical protein